MLVSVRNVWRLLWELGTGENLDSVAAGGSPAAVG